ncbi:MAG TPA: hypothetical protein VM867_06690 [Xanthobacteraceae bacterium]|jgi:hypothetical protein|nr:hypothetical protein [Xanthobacteraceae bacterium]
MRDTSVSSLSIPRPVVAALTGFGLLLVAVTLVMWMHYGTAVFFEIIAAGIAMCL